MKFTFSRRLLPALCVGAMLCGCIDENYDLSDIDTTVRVVVDDLVVPINLNEATLKNILDMDPEPDPDSKIQVMDGRYAFVDNGSFTSEAIEISEVVLPEPAIAPTVSIINIGQPSGASAKIPAGAYSIDLPLTNTQLSTETYNVSKFIVSVDYLETQFNVTIGLSLPELAGVLRAASFEDLSFKLPKGLKIGGESSYDPATGILNAGSVRIENGTATVSLFVTGIDCIAAGLDYDMEKSHLSFAEELGLASGRLVFDAADVVGASLPSSVTFTTDYSMGEVKVTSFTGKMKYELDGMNVSDVSLTDLPDVLMQQGTDLRIANPQIYISVYNPLARYSVSARSGFEITSYVNEEAVDTYGLDEPYFTISGTPATDHYAYYFSPKSVTTLYPGYEGAEHVGYAELSNVLSGSRVPDRLNIDFVSPSVPEQSVAGLPIGQSLGTVDGIYTFCAPLAFAANSKIVYADVVDGWASEDLDAVTIEALDVNATVSTDLPVGVHFVGYPVDRQGNQINGVKIEGADISAGASGQPLHIRITGAIQGLDGIRFEATVATTADTEALTPDMTIKLSDIRPRISGYYTKEL